MTMHMLPSYFTTTSTRKRKSKKKTESIIQEEIKTQKLLERLGYNKNHNATVWTCDFTKNYISINTDYRS